MNNYSPYVFVALIFIFGNSAIATTIETTINSYVNNGGNTILNGESMNGSSRSKVKIYTEIDGQVVEDFKREISAEEEFQFQSKKEIGNSRVEIETKINKNEKILNEKGGKKNVKYETDQDNREVNFVRKILNYVFSLFKF